MSELETTLSFAIKEALAGLGEADKVDTKRPIVLTPQNASKVSVGIPLCRGAALRQRTIDVNLSDITLIEGREINVTVGEQQYSLVMRNGRAYASIPSLPLGPEALTSRQMAALERLRPDLPRWADENRQDRGLSLRVSFEMFSAVDERAKARGVPRSEILKEAIEAFLKGPEPG